MSAETSPALGQDARWWPHRSPSAARRAACRAHSRRQSTPRAPLRAAEPRCARLRFVPAIRPRDHYADGAAGTRRPPKTNVGFGRPRSLVTMLATMASATQPTDPGCAAGAAHRLEHPRFQSTGRAGAVAGLPVCCSSPPAALLCAAWSIPTSGWHLRNAKELIASRPFHTRRQLHLHRRRPTVDQLRVAR